MSIIFEGVEMPTACCFVDKEQIKHCKFYNICKKRDTIKTNCKPGDCPVKALEQEPRWITLSEKWPEDCQEVLVTTDEGDIVTDVFHVDSGGYYFKDRDIEYVTAWMPLPEPYKVESEDT